MPSVYNYRHVELDKVGRGKRVIQPPGGQTADIFGSRPEASYSSASSQAGSDVATSRMHIESDQQSVGGISSISGNQQQQQLIVDGLVKQSSIGHLSPDGSVESGASSSRPIQQQQQPLLMADDFKPTQQQESLQSNLQQQPMNLQQQKLIQMQQQETVSLPLFAFASLQVVVRPEYFD